MHATFWAAVIISLGCCAFALPELEQWEEYKKIHGKSYPDPAKDAFHFAIFQQAVKRINEHNAKFQAGEVTYSKRLAVFSDLPEDQWPYRAKLTLPDNLVEHNIQKAVEGQEIPDAIDWRKLGYVTGVKNQGNCGDCYIFAAIGSLEAFSARVTGILWTLSEQNIRECYRDRDHICDGGDIGSVFTFVAQNQGGRIDPENYYPYNDNIADCKYNYDNAVNTTVRKFLSYTGEDTLKTLVGLYGPVTVIIHASNAFGEAHKEVFYDPTCTENDSGNHAVLAVGYGTDPNYGDYWIIKNSWGTTWGDEGYVKMARNRGSNCHIGKWAFIPSQ
uniref:Pept_C1 domain-containing protein n=1 Tax=Panagrellus redivivus TaxID=6233 RepID=A0A7E4VMN1_PANRE